MCTICSRILHPNVANYNNTNVTYRNTYSSITGEHNYSISLLLNIYMKTIELQTYSTVKLQCRSRQYWMKGEVAGPASSDWGSQISLQPHMSLTNKLCHKTQNRFLIDIIVNAKSSFIVILHRGSNVFKLWFNYVLSWSLKNMGKQQSLSMHSLIHSSSSSRSRRLLTHTHRHRYPDS